MNDTITFTKENLTQYKKFVADAKSKGESTFVNRGMLQSVDNAQRLIDRFEPHFASGIKSKVTIPYNF